MVFFKSLYFLPFLLLGMPLIASEDNPLTPFYDAICNEVQCGKGKCISDIKKYPMGYVCECENGWTRTTDDDVNNNLQFLPCVIPQCTLKYDGCQTAPPPPPEKPVPSNSSSFDPCYWIYCGEGTCAKNSTYTHFCSCKSGYANILDIPYFPCYNNCTLGNDCSNLGITVAKSESTNDSTAVAGNSGNHGSSIMPEQLQWMILLFMSILMVLTKY